MIQLKIYNNKWQIEIVSETLEFDNLEDMRQYLDILLNLKEKKGRLTLTKKYYTKTEGN